MMNHDHPQVSRPAKDTQTRLFMNFMLVYLLILLSGWLNHLGQPLRSEFEPDSTALTTLPYQVGSRP